MNRCDRNHQAVDEVVAQQLDRWRDRLAGAATHVQVVAQTGSTNVDLARAAQAGQLADDTLLIAYHQQAGQGRHNRRWDTPPGVAVTASLWLQPRCPAHCWPWLTALTAVAVVRAVGRFGVVDASVKWPNDVLVGGSKIAGVLAEAVPDAPTPGVVVGFGVNIGQRADHLPPTGCSVVSCGGAAEVPDAAAAVVEEFGVLRRRLEASRGDMVSSGLHDEVSAHMGTLGQQVRAIRPTGEDVVGHAVGLSTDGALLIQPKPPVVNNDSTSLCGKVATDGVRCAPVAVIAADVQHLRPVGDDDADVLVSPGRTGSP